jgi:hypothetical protein
VLDLHFVPRVQVPIQILIDDTQHLFRRYRFCTNVPFCGGLLTKEVKKKRGGRDVAAETRYSTAVMEAGLARAAKVQANTMVGSECTNETEPYIISVALSSEQIWEGPDSRSWMGTIQAGDKYIHATKLIRGATELMYVASDRDFYINSEDVRVINMQHQEVQVRRSARQLAAPSKPTYEFNIDEIALLQMRCWQPI